MKSKIYLVISGGLLVALGILSFINNSSVISSEGAKEYSSLFNAMLYVLPLCFLISGVLGILAGIINKQDSLPIKLAKFVGLKLALLPAILFSSAYITGDHDSILIFTSKIFEIIPALNNNSAALFSIIAIIIHFYLTGIEFAEQINKDWTRFYNTRAITRFLILFIFCFIYTFGGPIIDVHKNMTTLVFASYLCWGMGLFSFIRWLSVSKSVNFRSVKMVFLTIGSTIALILFASILDFLGGIYIWFGNLTIYIPIILLVLGLILLRTRFEFLGGFLLSVIPILFIGLIIKEVFASSGGGGGSSSRSSGSSSDNQGSKTLKEVEWSWTARLGDNYPGP